MSEWREATIDELCVRVTSGGTPSRKRPDFYADEGIPWVKSQELVGARITATEEHISDAGLKGSSAKLLPPETVLMAMYGANVGQLGWLGVEATVNQAICAMVTDPKLTDSRFLYYALAAARSSLISKAHGAAQQNLSQQIIKPFPLRVPDLATQQQIGGLLRSIDDLIENNRRRVEVLEQMARGIYREWFVKYRYPGHEDVPPVDSALGRIPQGWEHVKLYDAAEVGFGFSFKSPRFATQGPHQVIRIRDIPVGISSTFTDEAADTRYAVRDDDVLIGMDGDFHMTVWTGEDAWLNQRVTRLRPRLGMSPLHLLLAIESQIADWNRAIVGTTVAHLGKKHLELVTVLVPDSATLERATEMFGSFMGERRSLEQSNRRLAKLRDLLLPKLVTGQIDMSSLDLAALVEGQVA